MAADVFLLAKFAKAGIVGLEARLRRAAAAPAGAGSARGLGGAPWTSTHSGSC